MHRYYLGIDVGTTGIKGILVNEKKQFIASARRKHRQYFPHPGWVEQDPFELLQNCLDITAELMTSAAVQPGQIMALGLDHQGESCLIWEKATGQPVYPVITWQDRRMAQPSDAFGAVHADRIRQITGLRSDSYYTAWKLRWLLEHIPDGFHRAQNGELLGGTLNTWLIWNFTGGKTFLTDDGSAAVTMLADPRQKDWDPWLLQQLQIPRKLLPDIVRCDDDYGFTDPKSFPAGKVAIRGSFPDCSAGIIAAGVKTSGGLVTTYGTGNFMHLTTGSSFPLPEQGLTSSCCYTTSRQRVFQLNGINYTAGSALEWLRKQLQLFEDVDELEELVHSVSDSGGVYFVPALNGLATPFWDQSARGAFLGMTAATSRAHLIRSVLESSALQVANCFEVMQQVSGLSIEAMVAMGGMTNNRFLMQLQADLLNIPVLLPQQTEPAYGAACFAASAFCGEDPAVSCAGNPYAKTYLPGPDREKAQNLLHAWRYAANRCLQWYPHESSIQ